MGFILGFLVSEAYAYETFALMNLFTIWFEAFILGIALLGLAEMIFLLKKIKSFD